MSERAWKWLRELVHGSDLGRAAHVERDALARAEEGALEPALVRDQARLAAGNGRGLILGEVQEGPRAGRGHLVEDGIGGLLAHHHVLGGNGAGKTRFLLGIIQQVLVRDAVQSVVVLDLKNELFELLTGELLPAIAATRPPREADAFLRRIVTIDPFSPSNLPPLNVLVRDPCLPIEVQARDVAECFEAATETDVSSRMQGILEWVLRLVIEVGGTFGTLRRALEEPAVLDGLVRASQDGDVRRYFAVRFGTEPKASRLALLARLDRFMSLPMTRLCLGAKGCVDFDQALDDRIVVVALGGAPAGLHSVARFFAMILLTRLVRAIFRRPVQARGFASILVADEWQLALNPALAAEWESVLALARSRGVFALLANQQLAQLDAGLRSTVLGQATLQSLFRTAPEDARALRHLFPVTGTMRRTVGPHGGGSPFLAASEELDVRVMAASRMPNRMFVFADRRKPWAAVPLRTVTVELPDPRTLPADYVLRATRGTIGHAPAALAQMLASEDQRLDQLAQGSHGGAHVQRVSVQHGQAPSGAVVPAVASMAAAPAAVARPAPRVRRPRGGGGLPQIG